MLESKIRDFVVSFVDFNFDFYDVMDDINYYKLEDNVLTFELSSLMEDEEGYAYKEGYAFAITATTATMRYGYADGWLGHLKWEEWEDITDSPELEALRRECF